MYIDDDEDVAAVDSISVGGEKVSAKIIQLHPDNAADDFDDENTSINFSDVTKLDDQKFLDGLKLGIGLAFLSMALNGFTDDLLFNIPSAMLMWILGALVATINSIRN